MSGPTLTPEQSRAARERGGALLVSAGAGAGKTRVLVERLMARICDPAAPRHIDDFLVITYTKAAAAELRGRILDALTARLSEEPENRHLRRQLTRLPQAHISTVHAFCKRLLEERAPVGLLPAPARLMDEAERGILHARVLEEVLARCYEEETAPFAALLDATLGERGDGLLRTLVTLAYEKTRAHPDPAAWADAQTAAFAGAGARPVETTPWGRLLLDTAAGQVDFACAGLERARAAMRAYPAVESAYGPAFERDVDAARAVRAALAQGWDETVAAVSALAFARLSPLRGEENREAGAPFRAAREAWKQRAKALAKRFDRSDAAHREDLAAVAPVIRGLFDTVRRFEEALAAEKRRLGVIDFFDLEHGALALLTQRGPDGPRRSAEAERVSARYAEILVDEYQDISLTQESIVQALSRAGRNLFFVGDVRQSIYRFRLAEPGLFLEKYRTFPDVPAGEDTPRRVLLSRNFRSRPPVLDAVNCLFQALMSEESGEMAYTEREFLESSGTFPETEADYSAELLLTRWRPDEPDPDDGPGTWSGTAPDAPEEEFTGARAEASVLAARLRALLDARFPVTDEEGRARPVTPGDMVILLRAPALRADVYREALAARGIPCRADGGDVLSAPEVQTALAFLAVVDNPRQDIPLLAVMRSPVYGFDADRLAALRAGCPDRGADLYTCLRGAAGDDEGAARLCADLNGWRLLAPDLSARALLDLIYEQTGLPALYGAQTDGAGRQAGLRALSELAARFEAGGARGLFAFLRWVEALGRQGPPPASAAPETGDAVRIMSIHRAKGLEFPVVAVADCAKRFNEADTRAALLFHPVLGVGPKRRDSARRIEYPTLAHRAVAEKLTAEMLAEEMRVLYVAMTRAKEKLILSAAFPSVADARQKWETAAASARAVPLPPQLVLEGRSYADWLLLYLACTGAPHMALSVAEPAPFTPAPFSSVPSAPPAEEDAVPGAGAAGEALAADVARRLAYAYPHADAAALPSKLTATALKGRFLDQEAAEEAERGPGGGAPRAAFDRPRFVCERTGPTAAERGTALHLFMQFADFTACRTAEGARAEAARLRKAGLLTEQQAGAVSPERVAAFFRHPLGLRLLASPRVVREFKFSLLVPAASLLGTGEGEEILLQGVVDCYFEEADGLTVIDFKTDAVAPGEEPARAALYRPQVEAYARALAAITGRPVTQRLLYFFQTDKMVIIGD
ncbi:MAG: UvrD-helicase domain-containing protein [Oscillospiraceae bacterium]|jgi:ATP-dependent helicase/nuclease subunit A|nr:UvrD-helicase domain-containing protein [Oscillospiraceae bacterium]